MPARRSLASASARSCWPRRWGCGTPGTPGGDRLVAAAQVQPGAGLAAGRAPAGTADGVPLARRDLRPASRQRAALWFGCLRQPGLHLERAGYRPAMSPESTAESIEALLDACPQDLQREGRCRAPGGSARVSRIAARWRRCCSCCSITWRIGRRRSHAGPDRQKDSSVLACASGRRFGPVGRFFILGCVLSQPGLQ